MLKTYESRLLPNDWTEPLGLTIEAAREMIEQEQEIEAVNELF